jgi:hypothetical protein
MMRGRVGINGTRGDSALMPCVRNVVVGVFRNWVAAEVREFMAAVASKKGV